MRRWDTPTLRFVTNADLTGCEIRLAMAQGRRTLILGTNDVETEATDTGTAILVTLAQIRSARFDHRKPVEVQLSVLDANGYRASTNIAEFEIGRQLTEGLM